MARDAAYRSAWAGYIGWCRDLGREPLAGDPETIAMYAVRRADAGCSLSTIRVELAAIRIVHLLAGVPLDLRDARLAPVPSPDQGRPAATSGRAGGAARHARGPRFRSGARQGRAARARPGWTARRFAR